MNRRDEEEFGLPDHAVKRLRSTFQRWPGIDRVLLYGSRAKGDYRKASDIDLCIEGPSLSVGDLLALETEIDDLLLPWRVDLTLRHTIDDRDLLDHIERVGALFYEQTTQDDDTRAAAGTQV